MALAGPFWREEIPAPSGLFIYDVSSQSAADSLASTDPAVMANRLKVTNYLFETDGPINYDIPVEMVTYVSCFYRVGPNFDTTMPIVTEELVVHQTEQIRSVSENGRLVMAGSFGPNEANPILHSFLVFAADSLSQVERAVENAPGVKSEQLVTDVMYWYGPAGLKAEPATKEPNDSLSN